MGKESKIVMIRQGCGLILASLALSLDLPYDTGLQGEAVDRWGMDMTVMVLGLAVIFFIAGKNRRQRQMCLNIACGLFALSTVIGRSFMRSGNCSVLVSGGSQICATLLVTVGYYLIYKNVILFLGWFWEQLRVQAPFLFRREVRGGIEKWLFESHPVLGIVLMIWILGLPWLICFFPGAIEPDACVQLRMALGMEEMTAHHPVAVTKLMGKLLQTGQFVFGADFMGIFLYTIFQFGVQSLVVAYVIYVMGCMKTPVLLRWGTLAFYSLYPVFPMWGYTMVKDAGYCILVLLLVAAMIHMLYDGEAQLKRYQILLLLISALGICLYRKDGLGVVGATLVCGILMYKKRRKIFAGVLTLCLAAGFLVNNVYCKIEDIPSGSIKEALSIPLQQTARFARDHYDDITQEEAQVLRQVFEADVTELAELYDPEFADPVKEIFVSYPGSHALKAYLGVWWQQFLKYPGTYAEAFLNHMYGYICPDKADSWEGEDIGVFHTCTEGLDLDVGYVIKENRGRHFLEQYSRNIKHMPVIGMIYSPGLHAWILLGCILYLAEQKKWRKLLVYIPGCCIWFFCILSPVNTCTRYALPLIALLPLHLLWAAVNSERIKKEYSE